MRKLREEVIDGVAQRNTARAADLVYYFSAWDSDHDILGRRYEASGEQDGARTLTTMEGVVFRGPDGQALPPTPAESAEAVMLRHAFDDIDHPETEDTNEDQNDADDEEDDETLDPNSEQR